MMAMRDLNSYLHDCELLEIEVRGPYFTWERTGVAERIDWVFGNEVWKIKFATSVVDHLARVKSNHRPFSLDWMLN